MNKRYRKFNLIYLTMAGLLVFVTVLTFITHRSDSPSKKFFVESSVFDAGWTVDGKEDVNLSHLNDISGMEPYSETVICNKLPDTINEGVSLCFRSKNVYYKVYVDGELRYEPDVEVSPVYNDSLGTRWNYVPLYSSDAGKNVEIRFYTVYNSSRACFDHIVIGNPGREILSVFSEKSVAVTTCLLILFVGLLLIVADIPINMQMQKNHELLYLGMFAVSVAVWCTIETDILQFFMDDSRLIQFVSCCSLMMIPIPMVLYLDVAFGFRKRIIVSLICWMSAAEFLICSFLHFSGILDYHSTLTLTHILLVLSALILLVTIFKNAFSRSKNPIKNIYKVLRAVGLMGIGFATGIDILRYYFGNVGDTAMFVRIGLLVFILCYGISSLEKTINAVKLGVQTEFISQLAYRDGLTGIGNRTAFQERLIELENDKNNMQEIGIIMFDVNDLKYVNDNLGHQEGDNMLVCGSELIKSSMEPHGGLCYRIGGDEFAAIISGQNAAARCEAGISDFTRAMKDYNHVKDQPFRISIASGYAIYDETQKDKKLMDIYQIADSRMYENKKAMKASQAVSK